MHLGTYVLQSIFFCWSSLVSLGSPEILPVCDEEKSIFRQETQGFVQSAPVLHSLKERKLLKKESRNLWLLTSILFLIFSFSISVLCLALASFSRSSSPARILVRRDKNFSSSFNLNHFWLSLGNRRAFWDFHFWPDSRRNALLLMLLNAWPKPFKGQVSFSDLKSLSFFLVFSASFFLSTSATVADLDLLCLRFLLAAL